MKFEIIPAGSKGFSWSAYARNGNIVASAHGYNTKAGARKAARAFVKAVKKLPDDFKIEG